MEQSPSSLARSLDLYKRLARAVERYEQEIEVEADQRLYVRPLLEAEDLLLLHARHCYEVVHKEPASQKKLADVFGVSQQRIAAQDKKLRETKAIDKDHRVTVAVGRVGVSVVQYCHHAWADEQFGELVTAATERAEMRLKHPDREQLQPKLLVLVKNSLKELDERLGDDARLIRTLITICAYITKTGSGARARDLSVEMGIPSRTLQEQIRGLRALGWMRRTGFAVSERGRETAEKAASIALDWTRETGLAMTSWTRD